jgi:hypothetical protein
MHYQPKPIATDGVELDPALILQIELLAAHVHDLWAERRIAEGRVLGDGRDDALLTHPCLVPYDELPESEKEYDRQIVAGLLKAVIKLGFRVFPASRDSG